MAGRERVEGELAGGSVERSVKEGWKAMLSVSLVLPSAAHQEGEARNSKSVVGEGRETCEC